MSETRFNRGRNSTGIPFAPDQNSCCAGMGDSGGIRALRSMRALRPLRTITRIHALRSIVACFMEAVPLLVSVVVMLFFTMFLFAIVGMQVFPNAYHFACANDVTQEVNTSGGSPDEFGCGGARRCPTGYTCTVFKEGTNVDSAGFDNIFLSMLTVFQCTTIAGWSFVMYRVQDSTSQLSMLYFVVLILFASYFVINLFLAVLKLKFGKAQSFFNDVTGQLAKDEVRACLLVSSNPRFVGICYLSQPLCIVGLVIVEFHLY